MSDLFTTIRQRKVVQWTVGYAAGAWIAFEVVGALSETWSWPPLVARLAFVALLTGLFVTGAIAWYHGERGHQRVPGTELGLLILVLVGGFAAGVAVVRADRDAGVSDAGTPSNASAARSVVVLPFKDLSPDGGRDYLGDGIAETLINALARIEGLRVVARTSAFAFRDAGLDVRDIAARLDAGTVLEGTVTQIGERVRITATLTDADGLSRWAETFDREVALTGLFQLQDEVAQAILGALQIELGASESLVGRGTTSPAAQRAFFLGQHHWTARTTEDMILAAEYFRQAIEGDSTWAEPWAGLALAYTLHTPSEYGVPGFTRERGTRLAIEAANRAIALDPELPEAYAALGDASMQTGRFVEAERHFRRAIALNPGYATAHHWLADLLMIQLRGEEALAELELAESLDPVAPAILVEKAEALMMVGRVDDAFVQLDRAVELLPESRLVRSFNVYLAMARGEWARAGHHLRVAAQIAGQPPAVAARLEEALAEPSQRPDFLRGLRDEDMADRLDPGVLTIEILGRPEVRFIASRYLDGLEPALEFLKEIIRGPDGDSVYGPVLPAVMGAEVIRTEAGREVMEVFRSR